jgi:soluble lytic murein transglycosylase-like protein
MVGRKQIPSTKFNRMRQIIAQMLFNAYGGEGLLKGKAMPLPRRAALSLLLTLPLLACGRRQSEESAPVSRDGLNPGETPEMRALIRKYAGIHGIPESLLHRVIQRESDYNPRARNGPYYGLMQILPQTAGTMGYRGAPDGLLDAETNLQYAGRYLRGAWLVSDRSETEAVGWYARGYYYEAKRRGLLKETGLRT